jgi:hypothetical protein
VELVPSTVSSPKPDGRQNVDDIYGIILLDNLPSEGLTLRRFQIGSPLNGLAEGIRPPGTARQAPLAPGMRVLEDSSHAP